MPSEKTPAPRWRASVPDAAPGWEGWPPFNFVGGHNDADSLPAADLTRAAAEAMAAEARSLAMYNAAGPLGHRGLREFVADCLARRTGMACDADEVLIVSGSLQALDLVNAALLEAGDAVVTEMQTYGGALSRIRALGAEPVGAETDAAGMIPEAVDAALSRLAAEGRAAKYVYAIPTVQNPTGTVMPEARRRELLDVAAVHDAALFEDDCYADLTWSQTRPPAIRALAQERGEAGRVLYCGSFSKTIAPALRVGYLVADRENLARLAALKADAGTGAIEQMTLARYAPAAFDAHAAALSAALRRKCEVMAEALDAQFGAAAEYRMPEGGIFIWATLPEEVDTSVLAAEALAEGVAINPGAEWCADPQAGRRSLRLCFANPSEETIREGVAKLAAICRRRFGTPVRSANV